MRILFVLVFSLALAGCKTTGVGVQVRKTDDGYWIGIKTEKTPIQPAPELSNQIHTDY